MKRPRLPELPTLDWKSDGTPVSESVGDVYFSVEDGLEEARSVFLTGCGLPARWEGHRQFTIAELGFGTGLNFLATWQLWQATRPMFDARLNFVSFEGYPLGREVAGRALERWPELADLTAQLLAQSPERMRGVQQIHFADGVSLTLHVDDISAALPRSSFHADAWFLDGFAPAKNLEMWDDALYPLMLERSAQGARIGTYTVAGAVRRGLSNAGFTVSKAPGFGRKRERLEAVCETSPISRSDTYALAPLREAPRRIAIIGAGIAGSCAAAKCLAQGVSVSLFDAAKQLGLGASGNPLALVMPRLDVDDTVVARASLEAYQAARRFYADKPGATSVDVLQTPRGDGDRAKFAKLLADPPCDTDRLASDGEGGLVHKDAVLLTPTELLENLLVGADLRLGTVPAIDVTKREVDGERFDAIVLANGMAIAELEQTAWLPLSGRLGQVEFANAAEQNFSAVASGHYALASGYLRLWGASFESHDGGFVEISEAATESNAAALQSLGCTSWSALPDIQSRAGIRATTPDKLPICGAVPNMAEALDLFAPVRQGRPVDEDMPRHEGLYVLGGLGSRGFGFAPLMADILASRLFDGPLPTEQDVAEALSPVRFLLRGLKRGQF